MTTLIQKLRDATSGSAELDALIWAYCNGYDLIYPEGRKSGTVQAYDNNTGLYESVGFVDPGERLSNFRCHNKLVKAYSTSLDAIIGLIEEKLPGWVLWLDTDSIRYDGHRRGAKVRLAQPVDTPFGKAVAQRVDSDYHQSAAIAGCLALLSALEGES